MKVREHGKSGAVREQREERQRDSLGGPVRRAHWGNAVDFTSSGPAIERTPPSTHTRATTTTRTALFPPPHLIRPDHKTGPTPSLSYLRPARSPSSPSKPPYVKRE